MTFQLFLFGFLDMITIDCKAPDDISIGFSQSGQFPIAFPRPSDDILVGFEFVDMNTIDYKGT